MKRRAGKTAVFSIFVDEETRHVSALVSAIAKEAKRQAALDWLLQQSRVPRMTEDERAALLAEIDGTRARKRRGRRAA